MLAAQRQSDVHTPLYMQKSLEFRESSYVLDPKPDAGLAERKHLRKRDKGTMGFTYFVISMTLCCRLSNARLGCF